MNDNLATNASDKAENPAFLVGAVRRGFFCLKCKEKVVYLNEDIDIMKRAEDNEGIFCSAECEYSFYNGGDGSDY